MKSEMKISTFGFPIISEGKRTKEEKVFYFRKGNPWADEIEMN
jgi:hypothetical protein